MPIVEETWEDASAPTATKKKRGRKPIAPKPAATPPAAAQQPTREELLEAAKVEFARLKQIAELGIARNKLKYKYAKTNDEAPGMGGGYPWQIEFHNAGAKYRYRGLICANRVGKDYCGLAEVAMHLTGEYPAWWQGKRFDKPTDWWCCARSNQDLRDIIQNGLLGKVEEGRTPSGEGWVPYLSIGAVTFRQCSVSSVVDEAKVKHKSGGWSTVGFRSFEQGDTAFQGVALDGAYFSEEPDNDPHNKIFNETSTRLMTRKGIFMLSRTPIMGATPIIRHFMSGAEGTWFKNVAWDDAPHLDEETKRLEMAQTPEHLRDAKSKGIPLLGTGAVYKVAASEYTCPPREIPSYFRRIAGIDFGIDHPAAAVWVAHDADLDIVYVYDCYRAKGQLPAYHAVRLKTAGTYIPVAWPHDGLARGKADGEPLMKQYEKHGVNMLPLSARHSDEKGGGQSREVSVGDILERMRTGRLKIFNTCTDLLEELRLIHRDDNGKIKAVNDDLESALRYALMSLRFAVSLGQSELNKRPAIADGTHYNPLDSVFA